MSVPLDQWRRAPRSDFWLGKESGFYALFLRDGAALPPVTAGHQGLVYIGRATGRGGLKGRCHFNGRTSDHSPRKSLAVLLMTELSLIPTLVRKPTSCDTWGLEPTSDIRLGAWMRASLDLAIEYYISPEQRETELIGHHAPPLNLTRCPQSVAHRHISELRFKVGATLQPASNQI